MKTSPRQTKDEEKCFICGARATTRDNIPPACIFPYPAPTDLLRVPACKLHNEGTSKDDEYFRFFVSTTALGSAQAQGIIKDRIVEKAKSKPKLLSGIMKNAHRKIEIRTPAGIFLGYRPGFKIDRKRINNIFNKIVRGLFYRHFKQRLSEEYEVGDFLTLYSIPDTLKEHLIHLRLYETKDMAFGYKFLTAENDVNESVWFFRFYNGQVFYCVETHKADVGRDGSQT